VRDSVVRDSVVRDPVVRDLVVRDPADFILPLYPICSSLTRHSDRKADCKRDVSHLIK